MYICNNCKNTFAEPADRIIVDRSLGSAAYMVQPVEVCPSCYSQDIDEGEKCSVCGEYKTTADMSAHMDGVCVSCLQKAVDTAKHALRTSLFHETYDLLSDYFDLEAKVV